MRMLVDISFPHGPFNEAVKEGVAGATIGRILDELKPESVYFTEKDGKRGATLIVDVASPSAIPSIAEPWFLNFNADCRFRIAMTPEDLKNAGLEELGQKWSNQLVA